MDSDEERHACEEAASRESDEEAVAAEFFGGDIFDDDPSVRNAGARGRLCWE